MCIDHNTFQKLLKASFEGLGDEQQRWRGKTSCKQNPPEDFCWVPNNKNTIVEHFVDACDKTDEEELLKAKLDFNLKLLKLQTAQKAQKAQNKCRGGF